MAKMSFSFYGMMMRFKSYNKWSEEEKILLHDSFRTKCREVQDRMRALVNPVDEFIVEENSVLAEIRRVCQFLDIEDCSDFENSIIKLPFGGSKHYLKDALTLSRETLNDEEFLVLPPINLAVLGRMPVAPNTNLRFALIHSLSKSNHYGMCMVDYRVIGAILECFHFYLGFAETFATNIKCV